MSITPEQITQISQNFLATEEQHAPLAPVSNIYDGITVAEAYQVQQAVVAALSEQYTIVGKKAGATSPASQAALQVESALFGTLFDAYQVPHGQTISTEYLIRPVLECEVAFNLKSDLVGPNITADDVLQATESIVAAFELVDFRSQELKPAMPEAISSNVYACKFVLGPDPIAANQIDLVNFNLTLNKNGEEIGTGTGAAALGNPALSVAWLANELAKYGQQLNAGDLVLSGAIVVSPVVSGDKFEAVFEGLGTIAVSFE